MTRSARITCMMRPTTTRMTSTPPWRQIAVSLVALSLLAVLTLSLASAAGAAGAKVSVSSAQPTLSQPSGRGTALAHGVVDIAKLPTITPHAVTSIQTPLLPAPDALTPTQRQAYNDRMRKTPPTAVPGVQQAKPPSGPPSFVGGGPVPLLVKQVDGLTSTQAGGGTGEAAIATDLSYVMEGTDNALAIYSASSGAKLYGPYSLDSFFAPVKQAGDLFAYPQLYYDVMRDRWIVAYLEIAPSRTVTYLDVAVSQTNSPTQPTPGAQYNIYQFGTNFEPSHTTNSYCDYETLGVEYWGLYITCVNYRLGSFVGNTVLAINKAPLLSGAANPQTYWWNDALKIASDAGPALELSPATEEGVQDAEFVVATDAGYGSTSNNLSACALSNLSNIASVAPTFSCVHATLPIAYVDPLPARQPGGPSIGVGYGTKQVYYKAGRLFLAWTVNKPGFTIPDRIEWAEMRPILTFGPFGASPTINGVEFTLNGIFQDAGGPNDVYTPSIVGTDEDDIVLVFNTSGPSLYPSLGYTGRRATDPFDLAANMGRTGTSAWLIGGSHSTTAFWGKYAACAISLNSVTRGGVWCVGEYAGSVADPGWNTRFYNLRAE